MARAGIGTRNAALNSEAYGLGRLIAAGLLDGQAVADELAAAAIAAGLTPREIEVHALQRVRRTRATVIVDFRLAMNRAIGDAPWPEPDMRLVEDDRRAGAGDR